MARWLLKTEPESYAWADLVQEGTTEWTGVRNHAAALNLKRMAVGDPALIYHSMSDKAAVGIAEVIRVARPESADGPWVSVAIRPVEALPRPVTLAAMKADPRLAGLATIRQSRLSVSPVGDDEWAVILELAGR